MSARRELTVTRAPALRQTRAAARSKGQPRLNMPARRTWSEPTCPKPARKKRHRPRVCRRSAHCHRWKDKQGFRGDEPRRWRKGAREKNNNKGLRKAWRASCACKSSARMPAEPKHAPPPRTYASVGAAPPHDGAPLRHRQACALATHAGAVTGKRVAPLNKCRKAGLRRQRSQGARPPAPPKRPVYRTPTQTTPARIQLHALRPSSNATVGHGARGPQHAAPRPRASSGEHPSVAGMLQ